MVAKVSKVSINLSLTPAYKLLSLLWYMQVCNEMKHGGHCRDVISGFVNKIKAKILTLVVI